MKTVIRMVVFLAAVRLVVAQHSGPPAGVGGVMSPISRSQTDFIQRTYKINGKVQTIRREPIRGAKMVYRATKMVGAIRQLHTDARGEFSDEVTLSQERRTGL